MAIRSTNKAAKAAIRAYIIDHAGDPDELGYDDSIPRPSSPDNLKETCRAILAIFRLEYGWAVNRMGEYRAFMEWMRGLPSALHTLPLLTYSEARQIVAGWLQQTEAEAARYDDTAVVDHALHLVTREIFACAH